VSGPLILYVDAFWANTWDCAPYVALREKRVPFTTAIGLMTEGTGVSPAVRFQAITGLEPALQHGDFWIAESIAIIEYIEDAFAPPEWPRLWPADLRHRARARQLMSWLRMELNQLREERDSTSLFYPPASALPPLGPLAARQAAALCKVVERLGPSPSGALFGDWCIADVDVAFALMRLVKNGADVAPALRDYANAVWSRPSVRDYVEHARPPHPPRSSPRPILP
jgi:glutathione S-transferase